MDVSLFDLASAACAITLGAVLQASTGLGGGLVIVPLLGLISLELVPGPVIFASLALSLLMTYHGRHSIKFRNTRNILLGLMGGIVLGTLSLSVVPIERAGVLFGALVLLAVAITAVGARVQLNRHNLLAAGALSGFMGTTAAIGAPVLALLYQHEEGKALRATLAFLYLISSILMIGALYVGDHFGAKELRLGFYLVPGFVVGYVLAAPLAQVLDKGYSRMAVLLISTISAVALIASSLG